MPQHSSARSRPNNCAPQVALHDHKETAGSQPFRNGFFTGNDYIIIATAPARPCCPLARQDRARRSNPPQNGPGQLVFEIRMAELHGTLDCSITSSACASYDGGTVIHS